jgi:hypothetical protein
MMIRFLRDEMTLKATLLVWEPMVTFNGFVSWVTSFHEKFRPLMTSTDNDVFFSIIINLHCGTNSLSIKHVNASKLRSVWASIITSLLHLIMININKHRVGSKNRL